MDRRSFLKATAAASVALPVTAAVAIGKPNGVRVSCEENDPGYRAYCMARGDGHKVEVYLDGAHQRAALMADEAKGVVKRVVMTPKGNFAHDGVNVLTEEVTGDVRIVFA